MVTDSLSLVAHPAHRIELSGWPAPATLDDLSAPLISRFELAAAGWNDRRVRSARERGELARVRRGWYVDGTTWQTADLKQRHLWAVAAASLDAPDAVVAGASAAAVWGIPMLDPPPAHVVLLRSPASGGRSEGRVERTVRGWRGAPVVEHRGVRTIDFERTVLEVAAAGDLARGLIATDYALRSGVSREALVGALERRSSAVGRDRVARAIASADPRSESVGESYARAMFIARGFEHPDLQVEFADGFGRMRVDFFWPSCGVVAEFDGRVKYGSGDGELVDPDVLWREKRREDRLRRIVSTVVRFAWSDLADPARVTTWLSAAGVPRARRAVTSSAA